MFQITSRSLCRQLFPGGMMRVSPENLWTQAWIVSDVGAPAKAATGAPAASRNENAPCVNVRRVDM
jgi:hypothetical protein